MKKIVNSKKIIYRIIILILISSFYLLNPKIYAKEDDDEYNLPEKIECYEDLLVWCDYLCANATYGSTNSLTSVKNINCFGTVRFLYNKINPEYGEWEQWNLDSYGTKITKRSEAKPGDIVVWRHPNPNSKRYGQITHVAILINPETGELIQSTSRKCGCISKTRVNAKSWSDLENMVCWSGKYADWNWGPNDESTHPDNIYILHITDIPTRKDYLYSKSYETNKWNLNKTSKEEILSYLEDNE